jgi:hypothetical protein
LDENDPAWKIAVAARASANSGPDALDAALTELKPSARDIARAYALCLSQQPQLQEQFSSEAIRLILAARLQVALVEEHVEAQRRMGRTITGLTWMLVVLTVVLVILGGVDIWMRAG